jgi:hypothetical protein
MTYDQCYTVRPPCTRTNPASSSPRIVSVRRLIVHLAIRKHVTPLRWAEKARTASSEDRIVLGHIVPHAAHEVAVASVSILLLTVAISQTPIHVRRKHHEVTDGWNRWQRSPHLLEEGSFRQLVDIN